MPRRSFDEPRDAGLEVTGAVETAMTGAFRVALRRGAAEEVLSPYGFVDTPSRRARLVAMIGARLD